jgi:hypothetical protein
MLKRFLLFAIIIQSFSAFSEEEVKELPPLNPKYMGIHGMKLFNKGSAIYASHMLKLEEPHNVQILYRLSVSDLALLQLVKDADLVTIKPDEFNLERLIRGEKLEINADVYLGNYKKDGMETYSDVNIVFNKMLFAKVVTPEKSSKRQKYDVVQARNNERILIHQIQTPPSYEHIIYLSDDVNCVTNFTASSAVPQQNEIHYKLTYCGAMKPLYYNSEDFQ